MNGQRRRSRVRRETALVCGGMTIGLFLWKSGYKLCMLYVPSISHAYRRQKRAVDLQKKGGSGVNLENGIICYKLIGMRVYMIQHLIRWHLKVPKLHPLIPLRPLLLVCRWSPWVKGFHTQNNKFEVLIIVRLSRWLYVKSGRQR